MAIFLSASLIQEVVAELLAGGYHPDTPAAIVYRASWEDEIVVRTTLNDLAEQMKTSGIRKQALILIGAFLDSKEKDLRSRLYDKDFKHEYR
jgi:precorrin-4/cobalt-precorrin-4 C11-methyltransferase